MSIFDYIGTKADNWVNGAESSPFKAAKALAISMESLVRSTAQIPDIKGLSPEVVKPLVTTLGIVRIGSWFEGSRRVGKGMFIIHWPSLLSNITRLIEDPRYLGISYFLLSFLPIFKARSFVLEDLLRRYSLTAFRLYFSRGVVSPASYPYPLSEAQLFLLKGMLASFSKDNRFVCAFSSAVRKIYCPAVMPVSVTKSERAVMTAMWAASSGSNTDSKYPRASEFSMVSSRSILTTPNLKTLLPSKFGLHEFLTDSSVFIPVSRTHTFINELLYARDAFVPPNTEYAASLYDEMGVRRFVLPCKDGRVSGVDDFRVVDLRKLFAARCDINPGPYLALLDPALRKSPTPFDDVDVLPMLLSSILSHYPSLVSCQQLLFSHDLVCYPGDRDKFPMKYSSDILPYILVFSKEWLDSILHIVSKTRKTTCRKKGGVLKVRCVITSFTADDGKLYEIKYARKHGHTVTTYPFHIDPEDLFKTNSQRRYGVVASKRLPGIYPTAEGDCFYTYAFLRQCRSAQLATHPDLDDFLLELSKLTEHEFLMRWRRRVRQSSSRGFSPEEDSAIIKYYRPGITLEDKDELYRICGGKTSASITYRAKILRRQLIEEGIYDTNELPYLNYNINIKNEIERAKAKKESNHA